MYVARNLAALAIVVVVVAGCSASPPAELLAPVPADPAPVAEVPDRVVVHVTGWVQRPGLVELSSGARVADALAAAGGALPGAELALLNLAAPLRDGDQVRVPPPGEATSVGPGTGGDDGLVDVNRATTSELERLPGVGPVLAERIVAYREEHGFFSSAEDLLDVPGIGEAKLAGLRDAIVVP